jgi:transmembrane sensor
MDQYKSYVLEDFVLDAEFQSWVRHRTAEKDRVWDKYKSDHPHQADDIQRAYMLLESVYKRFDTYISDEEIEEEISAMVQRIRQERLNIDGGRSWSSFFVKRFVRWTVAASLVLVVAWFVSYIRGNDGRLKTSVNVTGDVNIEMTLTENKSNNDKTIFLEDGTKVVLSPNSELGVPSVFGGARREVYLMGEAFFKVTRDVNRPFLVYSDKLITRVLGTSFIIKSGKASAEIVEVKEGKVSVFKKEDFRDAGINRQSQGVLVTSNQKVTLEEGDNRLVKTLSDAPEILPGKSGIARTAYVNTPVSKVLNDLKEAYQVDIVFDEELLSGCPLTAVLSNQSLKDKLEIVCEAIEAQYEIIDGKVMIYGKSCSN